MHGKRLTLDLIVVAVLVVGGVLLYPWGQRQYYLWLLGSPNPEQAFDARDALAALGPRVVPSLLQVVRTEARSDKRLLAFEALTEVEDPRVLPAALQVAAADWDQELQSLALQLLWRAGIREAQPTFVRLATDADPRIRFEALRGLLATSYPDILPVLIARIDDRDLMVAATAARALSQTTGRPLPFPTGDTDNARATRAGTVAAWKAWYAEQHPEETLALAVAHATPAEPLPSGAEPPVARDFALATLDGGTVRLSDFRGTPVLINFWATWCTPCIRETADLVEAAALLDGEAVILGVAAEDKNPEPAERELRKRNEEITAAATARLQTEAVHAFVAEHGIQYPVLFGDTATLDAYNAYALPTTVIVRPDGVVHRRIVGERSKDFFVAALREAAR